MTSPQLPALAHLLAALFTGEELWRFLLAYYPEVAHVLREDDARAELAFTAASALDRRGMIDRTLFARLQRERPLRLADIRKVQHHPPRQADDRPRSRLAWLATFPTLAAVVGAGTYMTRADQPSRSVDTILAATTPPPVRPTDVVTAAASPLPRCPDDMLLIEPPSPDTSTAFCLDRHEVTRAAFGLRCPLDGTDTAPEATRSHARKLCDLKTPDVTWATHPVAYISGAEAQRHCTSRGRRLPTRHEWYIAAILDHGDTNLLDLVSRMNLCDDRCYRATDTKILPPAHFHHDDRYVRSAPVGSFSKTFPSRSGLDDMFGNVAEIVQDGPLFASCGSDWKSFSDDFLDPSLCIHPNNKPQDHLAPFEALGFRCALTPA